MGYRLGQRRVYKVKGKSKSRYKGALTSRQKTYSRKKEAVFASNPGVLIYDATKGIAIEGMQKGPGSRFAGEKFRHRFKQAVEIIGLPNGDVLLRPKKK